MYASKSNLIIGFHGCEKADQQKLITDISYFKSSHESFDWLGHGMYFWEGNIKRAELWAEKKKRAGTLKEPKDALHVACAVEGLCNFFITTDSGITKKVSNFEQITIVNPLQFIEVLEDKK